MKSIANQYRDLKEGKMTQSNFMRNLRMTMPQYITNVTSFKDAVRILKNKSILNEAEINELSPQTKYNAAMKAAEKSYMSDNPSDIDRKKAVRQGNKFIQEIDPVLKKAVIDFGKSLGFETKIEKGGTGNKLEPIIQILMGNDLRNPEIRVVIKKGTDKVEGGQYLPDEAAERRLGNLIKQIQKKELDVELKESVAEERLESFYEIVGEQLEEIAREKYRLSEDEIEQMFESEWHSGKNAKIIEKWYRDEEEPSVVAERIIEDYLNVNEGDEEDEMDDLIKKIGQEEEEEKAIKGGFGIYDPMEEDQELNEYEQTYRKIDGVCYRIDDEGNRTKVADHYCRYSEDLNEAKKKKEPKKELHPNQIHPQELRMGIKVELEHTDDLDKAKKIALDHLAENPFYYTALKLSGIESPSAPKVKTPVEKKTRKKKEAVELVDKANAMQKVKMPKIVKENLNEAGGEYMFSGTLTNTEKASLEKIAPGIEIEEEELDDTYKTVVSHPMYNEKTLRHAVQQATGQLPQKKQFGYTTGFGDVLQSKLEALVREVIDEMYDGRDNLTNNLDEENQLSPEEKETLDDLLAVNEGFGDLLNKIKEKAKKGLITLAVLAALLSSSNYTQAQQQQIKQVAGIEMQQQKGGDINKMSNQEAYDYVFNLIKKNPDGALKQLQQFKGTSQEDKNDANMLTTFANSVKSNKPIENKDYMGKRFKMASNVVKTLTGATQQTAKYKEFY